MFRRLSERGETGDEGSIAPYPGTEDTVRGNLGKQSRRVAAPDRKGTNSQRVSGIQAQPLEEDGVARDIKVQPYVQAGRLAFW